MPGMLQYDHVERVVARHGRIAAGMLR